MIIINWNNIRPLKNSQNEGFEEFVCQLARNEDIANKNKFVRNGKPDAGVECYWILENGDEWAWQAKYFTASLDDNQWAQLDKSVKTVLDKHPNLTNYCIAIPNDPPDARLPNQKSMLDKWNDRVKKWEGWASKKELNVTFSAWWSSDLINRLSKPDNQGLTYFWFNQEEFTDSWFASNTEQSIADLGKRYTPNSYENLNVNLDISKTFSGLARGEKLKIDVEVVIDELLQLGQKCVPTESLLKSEKNKLSQALDDLAQLFLSAEFEGIEHIPQEGFQLLIQEIQSTLAGIGDYYYSEEEKLRKKNPDHHSRYHKFGNQINDVFKAEQAAYNALEVIGSDEMALANNPFLILKGDAGIGKSHLLADVITSRNNEGSQSLFLLGQHFVTEEDPWTQIKRKLDINNCSFHHFCGALNAKAEAGKQRIIIFIDAINEGKGRYFWADSIRGFAQCIKKYPWLGLVVSVRSSYSSLLLPEDLTSKNEFICVAHNGFTDVEYEATKIFFDNFGIEQPSIPLLHPEFQNPLFLLLFCEGLSKAGYSRIPKLKGLTDIIGFFINSVNQRLSKPNQFDYSSDDINIVDEAINVLMSKKFNAPDKVISYEEALIELNTLSQKYGIKSGLLDNLVSEGVFSKNLFWISESEGYQEAIYLAYERFEDHMMAKFLLEKHPNVKDEFTGGGVYYKLFNDSSTCCQNKGLLEALSIQIPESKGSELYSFAPHIQGEYPVVESFVQSLLWRNIEHADKSVIDYINDEVCSYDDTQNLFWDTIISLSSNPAHFFNSKFLHKNLYQKTMAERDGRWTIYLKGVYDGNSAIKRLIDWAWNDCDKSHISPESLKLSAVALAWLFTSTNRKLRDEATKALVCLLKDNIDILIEVLTEFKGVNDPYVYERLFAAAYGCALLSSNKDSLKSLATYVNSTIFDTEGEVYPHILLRDYARGVIEYAHHACGDLGFDLDKCRPPYKSDFPTSFPTNEELDKKYEVDIEEKREYLHSQNSILYSMTTEYGRGTANYGDFGRYTFQSALDSWDVNPDELSNIAVEWIFEKYGYDAELHGKFDREINSSGRMDSHSERIGKKYQWIALHEVLARVSDNCVMRSEQGGQDKETEPYQGPWQPYVRDIDPSMLVRYSERNSEKNTGSKWWLTEKYENWAISNEEWVHKTDDLPNPESLISVVDDNKEQWLVLEGHPIWAEPKKIGKEQWNHPHKRMWYQVRSYIVSEDKYQNLYDWAIKQDFMGRWMPEASDRYQVFDREYYWFKAHQYFNNAYYGGLEQHEIELKNSEKSPAEVTLTTITYFWKNYKDGSIEDSLSILKPSSFIYSGMKLKPTRNVSEFVNENNQLCCFSPSSPSPSDKDNAYLLINKKLFLSYLKLNNLKVIWTILGEKNIIGDFRSNRYPKRLEISGAYKLNGQNFEGAINTKIK